VEAVKRVERWRSLVYPTLVSLGISGFISCAQAPPPPPPQRIAIEPAPPPLQPRKPRAFPLPARKPSPPPENVASIPQSEGDANIPQSGDQAVALAPPETQPPVFDGSRLIGLDQPAATRLLGSATERADAPPATIWRYSNDTCELDLFFYLDLRSGKMRTLHYVFKRDHSGKEDCLRSLVVARGN
jgi:hypothetical protein